MSNEDAAVLRMRTVGSVVILEWVHYGIDVAKALTERTDELAASDNRSLLFNLNKTAYIDAHVLAAVLRALVAYRKRGGRVKVCCPNAKIKQIFSVVSWPVEDIHDTEEGALAAFGAETDPRSRVGGR